MKVLIKCSLGESDNGNCVRTLIGSSMSKTLQLSFISICFIAFYLGSTSCKMCIILYRDHYFVVL